MSPSRVIVCAWIVIFGAGLVYCQGSKEYPIRCELNDRKLKNNETIHYWHGDQSIVVCRMQKAQGLTLEYGHTNTSGMLKKIHGANTTHHVVGILLSNAPQYMHLYALIDGNTVGQGFRLNFEGSPGHQHEMCRVDIPQSSIMVGQIKCSLNGVTLVNLSTIHVNEGCQSNIVMCSVNRSDLKGEFGPERHQIPAAWIHYDGLRPHHIVMLQLKDIISDSATEVKMNALLRSTRNFSLFPFVFTVVSESTDPIPVTTATTMNHFDTTATTLSTTTEMNSPPLSVSLDSNIGLKPAQIAGSVIGAVLGGGLLIVTVVIVLGGVLVYCSKRKREDQQKSPNDTEMNESGVTHSEDDDVRNQSGVNIIVPNGPN